LRNTLRLEWAKWDDPGDYPSNAGAGPLPSRWFIADIPGEMALEPGPRDLEDGTLTAEALTDYLDDHGDDLAGLEDVKVTKWGVKITGDQADAWPLEWERA
jgi:hypothetical protein